jgi:hypothetical protein
MASERDGEAAQGRSPVALVFHHVVQARLDALFQKGARVLHVEPGSGAEAAVRAAGAGFDGAHVSLGASGLADVRALGSALAAALRPGASVVVSLPGPWPLPATIRRTLTGVGAAPRRRGSGFGEAPPFATSGEVRSALGAAFEWTDGYALGVLLPGPDQERWAVDHPQAFGLLAALERAVRRWPGLRQLGDLAVLEGRRREPA